jgi:RNA polymerase sigma-70 factor (ECF subfamily)
MSDSTRLSELVQLAQTGNVEAFGHLYDRTARLIRAVATDAGSDMAEDVTHDTFLRAYRSLGTLKDPERFVPWLVGIARLIVKERRRVRRFDLLPSELPAKHQSLDDDTDELLALVARLPEDERLAVRFFFLNERSIDETARLLDRSRSGTYAILQRAKAKLARWLTSCEVKS